MKAPGFLLGLLVVVLGVIPFSEAALAPDAATTPTALRAALVGKWVLDPEASADACARAQFGPRQQLTALPAKAGQPRTYRTNFTNKPFNIQEYGQLKSAALAGFRANTNAPGPGLTFLADGTGTRGEPTKPEVQDGAFQWELKGHNLTISNSAKGSTLQLQFTNQTQLVIPAYRGLPLVFRPEKVRAK